MANPATEAVLPRREAEEDRKVVQAMTREQLEIFLRVVHADSRLIFRFLPATGLRWGELVAVRWSDLTLDLTLSEESPYMAVRRTRTRGTNATPARYKVPKSTQRRTARSYPVRAGA